jgi:hypothetical protein
MRPHVVWYDLQDLKTCLLFACCLFLAPLTLLPGSRGIIHLSETSVKLL